MAKLKLSPGEQALWVAYYVNLRAEHGLDYSALEAAQGATNAILELRDAYKKDRGHAVETDDDLVEGWDWGDPDTRRAVAQILGKVK